MFCPNCRLETYEDIEYCRKCGVKLENKVQNCNHQINNGPTTSFSIVNIVKAVPGELKSYKWDDTFVKTNLVVIVAIMGLVVIAMLFMGNLW
ncbi:MAG: hypothetical protein ACPK7O_10240 [Methanobacterium sp.]